MLEVGLVVDGIELRDLERFGRTGRTPLGLVQLPWWRAEFLSSRTARGLEASCVSGVFGRCARHMRRRKCACVAGHNLLLLYHLVVEAVEGSKALRSEKRQISSRMGLGEGRYR